MGALTLAVTGANGFLGRHVVAEALARGHRVRALVRGGEGPQGAEAVRADLAEPGADLGPFLEGADAVVHAAAALSGSEEAMRRDTVAATAALLRAMAVHGHPRLVLAGSLSVYAAGLPGGLIDESSALEPDPAARDAYARAKLDQEALVRNAGLPEAWVLRIGALFGPGRTLGAHLPRLGPFLLAGGPIPVSWVAHAALACVLAAETPARGLRVVNVVDDDLPDARRAARACGLRAPVPVPWRALDALVPLLGGSQRLPGLLRRPTLRARAMPRRWPNRALHDLGWRARAGFEEAVGTP